MSNSLKRNCRILVSGVLRVILENLGVSGGGLGLPIVGLSPGSTKMINFLKRNCHFPVSGVLGVILENLGVSLAPGGWGWGGGVVLAAPGPEGMPPGASPDSPPAYDILSAWAPALPKKAKKAKKAKNAEL